MTTTTPARFTLDETAAAAWLAAGVAADGDFVAHQNADNTLPDIDADYCAALDDDGASATFLLVAGALDAGIITDNGPRDRRGPSLVWEYIADGDGDGYRWVLYGGTGEPILVSWLEGMSNLGGGIDTKGAASALAVLREAVDEGNRLDAQRAGMAAGPVQRVEAGSVVGSLTTAEILIRLAAQFDRRSAGDHCVTGMAAFTEAGRMAREEARLVASQDAEDAAALGQIQHILRDPEWGAGMLEDIAEILQRTGRGTDNLPDDEPTWNRH